MKTEVHGLTGFHATSDLHELSDGVRLGLALMQSGFSLAKAAETARISMGVLQHWRKMDLCGEIPPESRISRKKMH